MSMPPPVSAQWRQERLAANPFGAGVSASGFFYTHSTPVNKGFEWNLVAILDDESPVGEDCAFYAQANKYGTGSVWAGCLETCDMSFGVKYGNQVAVEVDVWTNGPDPENRRIGTHAVIGDARRIRTGEARNEFVEGFAAFLGSNNSHDTNAFWKYGVYLKDFWSSGIVLEGSPDAANPSHRGVWFKDGYFVVGFDFSGGNYQSPIRLGAGQYISLEGTDSVKLGFAQDRVKILVDGNPVFEVDIRTGDLYLKGSVKQL